MRGTRVAGRDANALENLPRAGIVVNRRARRPSDVVSSTVSPRILHAKGILQNGNFATIPPIPPGDAKLLGLRIPGSDFVTGNSGTSRSRKIRPETGNSRNVADRNSNMGDKSNADGGGSENRGSSGGATSEIGNGFSKGNSAGWKKKESDSQSSSDNGTRRKENPKSFQARLERGLRSLTNKTAGYRRGQCKSSSTSKDLNSKDASVDGNVPNEGKSVEVAKTEEDDVGDTMRVKSPCVSMRQLFSMAESWSSDSVASHSDSCTCCEVDRSNRRRPPCPVHGASSSFDKKIN